MFKMNDVRCYDIELPNAVVQYNKVTTLPQRIVERIFTSSINKAITNTCYCYPYVVIYFSMIWFYFALMHFLFLLIGTHVYLNSLPYFSFLKRCYEIFTDKLKTELFWNENAEIRIWLPAVSIIWFARKKYIRFLGETSRR